MQVSRYLFLILLALALDCCSERQFDSKTEGAKLLRRDAEWADLATAGRDVEKVVSLIGLRTPFFSFRGSLSSRAKRRFVPTLPRALIRRDSRFTGSRRNLYSPPTANSHTCEARTSSRCLGQMAVRSRCIFVEYQSGV